MDEKGGLKHQTEVGGQKNKELEQPSETQTIHVVVTRLGGDTEELTCEAETTLGKFAKKHGIDKYEIRIRKERTNNSYILQEGDVLVVVPQAIVGG